jgi:hypothetical protein
MADSREPNDPTKALQEFWIDLRTQVQTINNRKISDENCLEIARKIQWDCCHEGLCDVPDALQNAVVIEWWFRKCVIKIRDTVFNNDNLLTPLAMKLINSTVLECGIRVKEELCSTAKSSNEIY